VGCKLDYCIQKLEPRDFDKLGNIWDMSKHAEISKIWHDQLVSGNRIIYVYTENNEFIGECDLVFVILYSDYTIADKRIYLSRLIVKEENRKCGIGQILLDYVFDCAKALGFEEISLGVNIDNIEARWLFEKNGFTNVIFVGEDSDGKYVKLLKTL
jgi:ribosomal protein S18 acetylase RimI-like enzyme